MEIANVFGVHVGFESEHFSAQALTDCKVMRWSFEEMNRMACHCAPAVGAYWRNLLLFTVANELNRQHAGVQTRGANDSRGNVESEDWILLGAPSRDFTRPLDEDEIPPKVTVWSVIHWALSKINPWPLPGMRHSALPLSGVTARNRVQLLNRAILAAGPENYAAHGMKALKRSSLSKSIMRHVADVSKLAENTNVDSVALRAQKRLTSVRRNQNVVGTLQPREVNCIFEEVDTPPSSATATNVTLGLN